ncbi:MAG: hypothetical protein IPN61_01210 [Bacteroidetes bacterium]|nr:hypothetical protein [Bacteroidota bacterium]
MKQKELYLKDIYRPIEGVIKANDERHLLQELEEYVLTNELLGISNRNKMLPGLFEELTKNNSTAAFGFPATLVLVSLTYLKCFHWF